MKTLARIIACAILLPALAAPVANAQGRKELRINEVMVVNDSSVVDNFGDHAPWIELFNPTHASVEINSIYITDDLAEPTKYYVPRGDSATKIGKRQSVIFFADGKPNRGTFHLNFTLTPGRDNTIYVFDADGKSLIDSVSVPASLADNCSYARTPDGSGSWLERDDSTEALAITPGGLNDIKGPNNKIAQFEKMDSHGFAMAVMAMSIVFCALLVLCVCFILIAMGRTGSRKQASAPQPTLTPASEPAASADAEVAAAIAMALHQHLNAGIGNARLTINHNHASAWTSKIQGMRQYPQR